MATAMAADWEQELEAERQPAVPLEIQGSVRVVESQQQELNAEIERAKGIVGREIDGEAVYAEETLDRAVAFFRIHSEWLWKTCGTRAPIPMVGPGPARSVDLFWQKKSWKLLVNIPAADDALATFYGDDYGRQKTKGTVDPQKFSINIAACLMV